MDKEKEVALEDVKKKYTGKKLLEIISLKLDGENRQTLKHITGNDYEDIQSAQLLLFSGNKALVFVDFDCDGYRSGPWYVLDLKEVLDKGNTTGIKTINSVVRNMEYFDTGSEEKFLITTDEYVIAMGQNACDDYYPSNFFNIEEIKDAIIKEGKIVKFE